MSRRMTAPQQPGLFTPADPLADVYARAGELVARLPPRVYLGTSSWAYPGWRGRVFAVTPDADLASHGLTEYARHPLLRTAGIDRGYYRPIPEPDLARYAAQVPQGFRFCVKATAEITSVVAPHGRGTTPLANPLFLSAAHFHATVGDPLRRALGPHLGPVLIELPPAPRGHTLSPEAFAHRLDGFLAAVSPGIWCAVELRDPALLTPAYVQVLAHRRAGHVYNAWRAMPPLQDQHATVAVARTPFSVLRLLLPRGGEYDQRRDALAPFDRIQDPQPGVLDAAAHIVRTAVTAGRAAFVLAGNKLEGCAPETLWGMATRLATSDGGPAPKG